MVGLVAKYQRYAEYKDSGVEWLGEIPEGWEILKLKYVAENSISKIQQSSIRYIGMENISSKDGKYIETAEVVPEGISNSFRKGDVLFGKLRPYLAKSWLADFSGICSSEFLILRSLKLNPKFLQYYTLTEEFIEQVSSSTYGSKMPRASWEFIGLLPVPICNYELTEKIANFLDHETAKIDSLIEKQQQLIQLLKEKRQAVISHAVTKGLDPRVKMKDSGVEWLGEVPKHWEIKKIKYLGSILNGYAFPSDSFTEEGVRVLKISNIQNMYLDWSDLSFVSEILAKTLDQFSIKKGDLVFALTRPIISSGIKAAIIDIDEKILLNQRNAILRPNELCSKKWLYYMILNGSFVQEFNNQIDKTGQQPNISTTAIGNLAIPVAPIKEQNSIVEYIESKLKVIDRLILKAESAIQLMQERRTALISAAVTGKIDVRNWQNPNKNNEKNMELSV